MRVLAITQARFGSSRLPGKILKTVGGKTFLSIHLQRILKSKMIDSLTVATTTEPQAEEIVKIGLAEGCRVYKGSLTDVLDRFYQAAIENEQPDYVVRLTSDCPLIDPDIIDGVIRKCIENKLDYCSNTLQPTYPDGLDVEVFTFSSLKRAWEESSEPSDREHVTPYIWRHSTFKGGHLFNSDNYANDADLSDIRITLDEQVDYELISKLINENGTNRKWTEYITWLQTNKDVLEMNSHLKRK